jgi:hypothetical protein
MLSVLQSPLFSNDTWATLYLLQPLLVAADWAARAVLAHDRSFRAASRNFQGVHAAAVILAAAMSCDALTNKTPAAAPSAVSPIPVHESASPLPPSISTPFRDQSHRLAHLSSSAPLHKPDVCTRVMGTTTWEAGPSHTLAGAAAGMRSTACVARIIVRALHELVHTVPSAALLPAVQAACFSALECCIPCIAGYMPGLDTRTVHADIHAASPLVHASATAWHWCTSHTPAAILVYELLPAWRQVVEGAYGKRLALSSTAASIAAQLLLPAALLPVCKVCPAHSFTCWKAEQHLEQHLPQWQCLCDARD